MRIIFHIRIITILIFMLSLANLAKAELRHFYNASTTEIKTTLVLKSSPPSHDYGDRTKLSAFILCALLGFTGAHHFYMKRYFSGGLQLSFFLASTILSIFGSALFFSWLFILALLAWVSADLLLIIFGGIRLKKGKKLIPFEQQL